MGSALVSLLMGCAVGIAYGICSIRSPAPPVIALVGLLGMVIGEQAVITARQHWLAPSASHVTDSNAETDRR